MKLSLLTLLLIFTVHSGFPQEAKNFQLEVYSSLASGWWIYTLGNGYGIDRTDFKPKMSFEAKALYKPNRLGFGLGIGYNLLFENSMDAFEDTRAVRSKYLIADDFVKFLTYSGFIEYTLHEGRKLLISPQLTGGGFALETIHPEKDNFNTQWLDLEFGVVNEIIWSSKWSLIVKPQYQVLGISVKQETHPGENHRIYSFGLGAGIRYRW